MNALWLALILGALQGATEFLPVSSSGHLVLAQALFGLREPELFFDLILHLGTLLAVLAFYRTEFFGMLRELGVLLSPRGLALAFRVRPLFRLGALIVLGSIPTAILGLAFKGFLSSLFSSLLAVGVDLILTAAFLLAASFRKTPAYNSELEFPVWAALAIGCIQGLAIAPGLSRSGVTISLAILLGVERTLAARYSFLLSVPAIVGANAIVLLGGAPPSAFPKEAMLAGFAASALVGILCLALLSLILRKDRFQLFVPWCLAAGVVALLLHFHVVGVAPPFPAGPH
jgi:undecaprenyl-diphosphatase